MYTIERHLQGKYNDPAQCEDRLVVAKDLAAVIDGATAKGDRLWNGMQGGRFAAQVLGDYIEAHSMELANETADRCFDTLSKELRLRVGDICKNEAPGIKDFPRASVIIFNGHKNEVWNYGDCQCMIGGALHTHEKEVDKLAASMRSYVLERALLDGILAEDLRRHDIGREAIRQILETQFDFENRQVMFGYPVINGINFDPSMVATYPVNPGEEVVLASDGYPILCPTLDRSEQKLRELLYKDPLCFRENPGTKGLMNGMVSYDDRTYWRGRC